MRWSCCGIWMRRETFHSLLRPTWPLHYRFLRLLLHALRLLSPLFSPLRLHCCRQRCLKTCRLRLRHARMRRRSFRCHHHLRNPRRLTSIRSPATRYRLLQTRHRRLMNLHRLCLSRRLQRLGCPHHHQRNPRQLTSLRSPAPRYRRLQTRHRRLPNHHRLSRRLLRLWRPQFRLCLRGFITNTTGISATSAENIITKNHISTAGFAITNKIFLSVYSPQQGGGGLCASLVPLFMCVYTKSNKTIKDKKKYC
jgi:hypothetical protein